MARHVTLTAALARAAGQDAGNRSMRKAGRTTWSVADWNAAAEVTETLMVTLTKEASGAMVAVH